MVPRDHPIDAVVLGGSAGSLDALMDVLPAFTGDIHAAVFIVLHIPRQRPSVLCEIVASHCALPVHEAEDKEPIAPGVVYVAPPDYHLMIAEGPAISLSVDEAINFSRPSIDALFETAADRYGARVAGVILSGANSDGASGLAAIARRGGIALVQDPATAASREMVEAALRMTPNAQVAPPAVLAQRLSALLRP